MSIVIKRDDHTPRRHANTLANARWGQADKIKLSKSEFVDVTMASYIMAEFNTLIKITDILKENKDLNIDELIGELEIMSTKTWNDLASTKIGRTNFHKMYVEDLAMSKPVNKFFVNGLK